MTLPDSQINTFYCRIFVLFSFQQWTTYGRSNQASFNGTPRSFSCFVVSIFPTSILCNVLYVFALKVWHSVASRMWNYILPSLPSMATQKFLWSTSDIHWMDEIVGDVLGEFVCSSCICDVTACHCVCATVDKWFSSLCLYRVAQNKLDYSVVQPNLLK